MSTREVTTCTFLAILLGGFVICLNHDDANAGRAYMREHLKPLKAAGVPMEWVEDEQTLYGHNGNFDVTKSWAKYMHKALESCDGVPGCVVEISDAPLWGDDYPMPIELIELHDVVLEGPGIPTHRLTEQEAIAMGATLVPKKGMPLMVSAQASDPSKPAIVTTQEATVSGKWEVYSASGALLVSCDALFPVGESKIIGLQSCKLAEGISLDNAMFAIMQINHRLEEQVK